MQHHENTDWHCVVHGTTAVASFIDDQAVAGRPVHTRFRSVETWLNQAAAPRHGAEWRLIGSETLTLPVDPPAIVLPAKALDAYAGTYRDNAGLQVSFTRQGDALLASANGGPANPQKAEAVDVFFTPGHGELRKIFQRDPTGRITGFLYVRQGYDLLFRKA